MKKRALILLFLVTTFLVETASFVPAMQKACAAAAIKKSTCGTKAKKATPCCAKTKKPAACQKKEQPDTPVDNGCTDNPYCYNCPVCYTFLFEPQYQLQAISIFLKKDYECLNVSLRSDYQSEVWAPPDGLAFTV